MSVAIYTGGPAKTTGLFSIQAFCFTGSSWLLLVDLRSILLCSCSKSSHPRGLQKGPQFFMKNTHITIHIEKNIQITLLNAQRCLLLQRKVRLCLLSSMMELDGVCLKCQTQYIGKTAQLCLLPKILVQVMLDNPGPYSEQSHIITRPTMLADVTSQLNSTALILTFSIFL